MYSPFDVLWDVAQRIYKECDIEISILNFARDNGKLSPKEYFEKRKKIEKKLSSYIIPEQERIVKWWRR